MLGNIPKTHKIVSYGLLIFYRKIAIILIKF
nr:MAG TPA: hypothetical protein [Caudoviricetes sp.]